MAQGRQFGRSVILTHSFVVLAAFCCFAIMLVASPHLHSFTPQNASARSATNDQPSTAFSPADDSETPISDPAGPHIFINGQPIPLIQGEANQTLRSGDGQTSVHISSHQSSINTSGHTTSISISTSSHTESSSTMRN